MTEMWKVVTWGGQVLLVLSSTPGGGVGLSMPVQARVYLRSTVRWVATQPSFLGERSHQSHFPSEKLICSRTN